MTPEAQVLDLLIVGAGPAGLAASCAALDAGLSHVVVEREGPVQSLVGHPQQIQYFSPADELAKTRWPITGLWPAHVICRWRHGKK